MFSTNRLQRPRPTCIVLAPEFTYGQICAALARLGWTVDWDPTQPDPVIGGEPDSASWRHGTSNTRIVYSFHPAMFLRVLVINGENAADCARELNGQLPVLRDAEIVKLLKQPKIEAVLLGLHAARALSAVELVGEIAELTNHAEKLIAGEATETLQHLLFECGELGLRVLSEWKSHHPEHSALFLLSGKSRERCQLLRWIMRDQKQSNPHIDQVLRTALEDDDWEVRVTALLTAARLNAVNLIKEITALKLPTDLADGVNQDERRMLQATRHLVIDLLQGKSSELISDGAPGSPGSMLAHLYRCIRGQPVEDHDGTYLFMAAICNPLPTDYPEPVSLPAGIVPERDCYRIDTTDIALTWIPPIEHWLGAQLPKMRVDNPIRQHKFNNGFFIGRDLFSVAAAHPHNTQTTPVICGHVEAEQHCASIGSQTGLAVRLPSADEWEMAARGPDGRRFPWGNNARHDEDDRSPWGLHDVVGKLPQWTSTSADGESVIVCGGKKQLVCAQRDYQPANSAACGFRIVIEAEAGQHD